jgi:hypothetical protein
MNLRINCIFILVLIGICNAQAQFAGGDGTSEEPYLIENLEQLQNIDRFLDKHFYQIADIDASKSKIWNDGKGFKPLGDENIGFSGTYNGGDFRILNLHIAREDEDFIGLFGNVTMGKIDNVSIENIYVTGNYYVGGVAGAINEGEIDNTNITGAVYGFGTVGGLLGYLGSGNIKRSSSAVHIKSMPRSRTSHFGGLVGFVDKGTISESTATGVVDGRRSTGGLIGRNNHGVIIDCYASGNVSGQVVGGLIGYNVNGKVISSDASSNVSGPLSSGSLVGFNINGEVNNHKGYGNINPIE